MNRPEPCEFCGRRPLSPGGRRLREHLRAIWAAPTPWEIERAKEADIAERTIATMKEAQPVAKNGEKGKGRSNSFDNIKANKGGTSAEYLAGLLKRDHPDIATPARAGWKPHRGTGEEGEQGREDSQAGRRKAGDDSGGDCKGGWHRPFCGHLCVEEKTGNRKIFNTTQSATAHHQAGRPDPHRRKHPRQDGCGVFD